MEIAEGMEIHCLGFHLYRKVAKRRKYFAGFTPVPNFHDLIREGLSYKAARLAREKAKKPAWSFDQSQACFFHDRKQGQDLANVENYPVWPSTGNWPKDYTGFPGKLHVEKVVRFRKARRCRN
jgi:hypothetical protein